jgi:DNA-binding transcriptional MerR regulator
MTDVAAPSSSPGTGTIEGGDWRIDDLARRSGVTVDTIRFYQREGLLPPAPRVGRCLLFGPAHLRRLEQIRDLQSRHFNLAAVRALLTEKRMGAIQAMFSADEASFLTRDNLINRSGLDAETVDAIERTGLLVHPDETGRDSYDEADLELLTSIRQLIALGMPSDIVLFLARLYAEHFADMQRRVTDIFEGHGELDWPEVDRQAFVDGLGERVADVFALTANLLKYAHQATVRRMTLTTPLTPDDEAPFGATPTAPAPPAPARS